MMSAKAFFFSSRDEIAMYLLLELYGLHDIFEAIRILFGYSGCEYR